MNYEFSLNKTALISLLVGSVVFALLLFGGGLIVGAQWLGTSSGPNADARAQNREDDLPKEPVLNDEEAAPKKTAPAPAKNGDPKTAPPAKDAAEDAPAASAAQAAETRPAADGEIKIIQEAEPANDQGAQNDPEFVTVQVGVFLDQEDANRLLKDIERKGYAPSFFSGRDAEARQWFAVRIGAYSDRQQAANAAANFTRQEKMKAIVRPVGSL